MGCLPDHPDPRDHTSERSQVSPRLGALGAGTANAGVGLVEYFERRAFGNHIDGSWPFLCKTSRRSLHWSGDTGAFLCNAMGALVLFGVPPE
jgi:C1A family cysteine protease